MKYDFNKAFPYPVLTDYSDDFMDSAFQASADLTIDDGQVSVESIFQLSEENIIRLIDEKKAAYALLVTCNSTYFRKLFIAEKNEIHETLDNGRLHGKVELRPYVVITKDVLGFHSSNINPEYSDSRFDYPKGAVIALDQPVIYYIDQEDFKVFGSVVRLRADKNCKDDFRYTIEGDHIVISVSPAIKKMIDVSIFDAQKKEFIIL